MANQKKRARKAQPRNRRPSRSPPKAFEETPPLTVESILESTGHWTDRLLITVGTALHDGRAVEPILEGDERYNEDLSYDDLVGITYAPLDCEADGFRITARPRRIGVREVAGMANPSCRQCYGRGYFNITRAQAVGLEPGGRKIMQDFQYEKSCGCAEKRYKAEHKHFVIDSQLGEWIAFDDLAVAALPEAKQKGAVVVEHQEGRDMVVKVEGDVEHGTCSGPCCLPEKYAIPIGDDDGLQRDDSEGPVHPGREDDVADELGADVDVEDA